MVTEVGERDLFPAFLYVYVADADETYRRALDAGDETMEAPADTPHGDRRAMVRQKSGTNPWDKIKSEGSGFSLIDPTPAWVRGRLVRTYPIQHLSGQRTDRSPDLLTDRHWGASTPIRCSAPADDLSAHESLGHGDGAGGQLGRHRVLVPAVGDQCLP